MPSGNTKKRDYLFDNYKALLIALVVIGHFIELSYKDNEFLYALKWLVVSFHMPAFIFISGYFSKRALSLGILFQKLAIPYIIYEIIYYLVYTFIIHKPTGLYLLYPKFSLWYIQALFFWRLLAPHIRKIPHYMAISILAGLLAGCLDMPDNFLSIPRTLVFFPYFLAGSAFDRSLLVRMRTLKNRMIACAGVAAFACFLAFDPFPRNLSPKIFYGRYNYDYLDQSKLFKGTVVPKDRSLMNVPFVTGDKDLDAKFVKEAKEAGFENLKGHRTVGGMRASIYNAMPYEGVVALVEFMKKFEEENL